MNQVHRKLVHISKIDEGNFIKDGENENFVLYNEIVSSVRIFGTVVEITDTSTDATFVSVTLDDGTGSIRVKMWKQTEGENLEYNHNFFSQFASIIVGDLVEIVGNVRRWENEIYVRPINMQIINNIDWEINRRVILLDHDIESKGMDQVVEQHQQTPAPSAEKLQDRIESYFQNEDGEISLDELCSFMGSLKEDIEPILKDMVMEAAILQISADIYKKLTY